VRIALVHNLQTASREEQAEYDTPQTVSELAAALREGGHEVIAVEASGEIDDLIDRLRQAAPEMIFNTAEGKGTPLREAFYPELYERLGFRYTGSDSHTCAITLDKNLTKLVLREAGIPVPRSIFVTSVDDLSHDLCYPVIAKPNFEGSSMGITVDSVVESDQALRDLMVRQLERFPDGLLVEEFIEGRDLVVPFIEGVGTEEGVLEPCSYRYRDDVKQGRRFLFFDLGLKLEGFAALQVEAPATISAEERARTVSAAQRIVRRLRIHDVARMDFRITDTGELYFLEINALPSLERGASIYLSAALAGLETREAVLGAIVRSAVARYEREQDRAPYEGRIKATASP
jgi:D-alanine-D-alanine ligase